MPPEKVEKFGEQVKRPGPPAEVAAAYVMLASDEGSYFRRDDRGHGRSSDHLAACW
jgi:hypothetical protein